MSQCATAEQLAPLHEASDQQSPSTSTQTNAHEYPSTNTDNDLTNPNDAANQIKTLKRQLATVSQQLSSNNKRARKVRTTMTLGRGIRRVANLYDSISSVLDELDAQNSEPPGSIFDRSRQHMATSWPIILDLVPPLKQILKDEEDIEVILSYINELQHGANSARSDDVNRIKAEIATRLNNQYKPDVLLHRNDRSNRGIQHDVCGQLLCPVTFDWDDLEVRANIRASKEGFLINTNYYLRCLYSMPPANPKRIEEGFLRGNLLVQVYAAIFTSPSSADNVAESTSTASHQPSRQLPAKSSKSTKSSVSTLLGMNGLVTGRSIAYAAVMLVLNLTDASQWTYNHNNFSFVDFYNFIVDYFEENRSTASTRRVKELLQWWKRKIFPQYVSVSNDTDESQKLLLDQDDDY